MKSQLKNQHIDDCNIGQPKLWEFIEKFLSLVPAITAEQNNLEQQKTISRSESRIADLSLPLYMAYSAYQKIVNSIAVRPAETGGILLGPVGTELITDFFFDQTGSCSTSTYSPDHVGLSRRMKKFWLPMGIDMKGFVHSHPGRLARLSPGDLTYIRRLLLINEDMAMFAAPIIIPYEYRFHPFVVQRSDMRIPKRAQLVLLNEQTVQELLQVINQHKLSI